jgi:hypothetical protein
MNYKNYLVNVFGYEAGGRRRQEPRSTGTVYWSQRQRQHCVTVASYSTRSSIVLLQCTVQYSSRSSRRISRNAISIPIQPRKTNTIETLVNRESHNKDTRYKASVTDTLDPNTTFMSTQNGCSKNPQPNICKTKVLFQEQLSKVKPKYK